MILLCICTGVERIRESDDAEFLKVERNHGRVAEVAELKL
jgi:hypothetical protein